MRLAVSPISCGSAQPPALQAQGKSAPLWHLTDPMGCTLRLKTRYHLSQQRVQFALQWCCWYLGLLLDESVTHACDCNGMARASMANRQCATPAMKSSACYVVYSTCTKTHENMTTPRACYRHAGNVFCEDDFANVVHLVVCACLLAAAADAS